MEANYKETNSISASLKSYPMNGGEGPNSYANNSSLYQKRGLDIAKTFLYEEINKKLDVKLLCSSSNSFNIADLGCSVGPNTFLTIQNIIEAIKFNFQSQNLNPNTIEFQVFFNDHTLNDFNTLFKSLPSDRNYFAAGVPGTFHGSLFPKASLHFVHSSYSIQWLSKAPDEVQDEGSLAWNKGRILQDGSEDVEKAYASQFADDMVSFLRARAMEIVPGGFMALLLPCIPHGANPSNCSLIANLELMGSCLMDLAKRGLVEEAKVDSFNLPLYFATKQEIELLIQRNGCFKIKRMEQMERLMGDITRPTVEKFALLMRAGFEGIIKQHFGSHEFIEELFNHYTDKLIDHGLFLDSSYMPMFDLFVFLNRIK
ncbi:loganic acid O-methyltransferase-like isoform X1 [Pistacia vera]|uniref:loganic acid O-methyltransferase-like isoform X1 n=1 Tax=Pistacia vera TaxID=55513 RepID=UPI001263676D|nr:loganic acid O-methyltransferase-like isoform X1 [Pistacia vera]